MSRIQGCSERTTSLAGNASKTVAGTEGRYLRIGRLSLEMFLCTLHGRRLQTVVVSFFWKGILGSVLSRMVRLSFPISRVVGCSITQFQFLISDPGGCFVSNELRERASVRIGLLTAPGEFHGLTADLENLI